MPDGSAAEAAQSSPVHRQAFRRAAASAAVIAIALTPSYLHAQCPDGSLPPCAGERRPAPPDPDRIAILPFHVTTADTLLGEGLAELLAAEFTGESGLRAAHMGTVIRAWRRNGGDLRTPLSQAQATRLAREVDAGRSIRSYRRYLVLRQDAEPVLVPQRDSVRAELARLEGRR